MATDNIPFPIDPVLPDTYDDNTIPQVLAYVAQVLNEGTATGPTAPVYEQVRLSQCPTTGWEALKASLATK